MAQQPESRFIEQFRKTAEPKPHAWLYEKLHGGLYQSGLPDTVWTWPSGNQVWIEFKVAPRWRIELLHGRQRLVCLKWATRGVPVYVIGQTLTGAWKMDLRDFVQDPERDASVYTVATAGPAWLEQLVDSIIP